MLKLLAHLVQQRGAFYTFPKNILLAILYIDAIPATRLELERSCWQKYSHT